MTVKLPGTYTGQQVVEAFKRSCSFQLAQMQYSAKNTGIEYQYEPGSVKQTVKNAGARLVQASSEFKKIFWFFGPIVERTKERCCAELTPIHLDSEYSEVEITAFLDMDWPDYELWPVVPDSSGYNKPLIEKLIGNFYRELQSLPASA